MKRTALLTIMTGVLLAMMASAAWAINYNQVRCSGNPCNGTDRADKIIGTAKNDVIGARSGNDRVVARAGNDEAKGGPGNDTIYGKAGADTLWGAPGNDFLSGATGDDTLYGGPGDDKLRGHGGDDTIYAAGDTSNRDYVNCGPGDADTAYVDTNDTVDGVVAETVVVNTALSCETLYVNGISVPTV